MEDDKVLITGSSGFIGRNLSLYYISKGYNVLGIDVVRSGICHNKFQELTLDIVNISLKDIFISWKPKYILHCAGNASVPISVEDPMLDFNLNVVLLNKLLNEINQSKVKPKILFLSSAAVYGNPEKLPVKEDSKLNPISPYGLHKKICEELGIFYSKLYNLDFKIARIFSAYGEGLKKQLLWDMHKKIAKNNQLILFGNGSETRDYIHIDDLVYAIDLIMKTDSKENIFNVANGEEISISNLAINYCKSYEEDKVKVKFNNVKKEGDPQNWKADIARLREIGYQPKVSIYQGITRYIKWVKTIE